MAVDGPDRISLWHTDDNTLLIMLSQDIPDPFLLDCQPRGDVAAIVTVIFPIAKAVEAERARILAARHAAPGGNCDGRSSAFQVAVDAAIHQPAKIGKLMPPAVKQQLRRGAIQTDDKNAFRFSLLKKSF